MHVRSAANRVCAAVLAALALPAALAGQDDDPDSTIGPGTGPEFAVSAGTLAPLAQLTTDVIFATEVSSALAVSGTATYWLTDALGVAAHAAWAPADLSVRPSEFTGPIPDELGEADFLAFTLNAVYRLRLSGPAAIVEPYFSAGGGLRTLSFDPIAAPDVQDATDPTATVAGGALVHLWPPLSLRLELRDFVSRYEAPRTGDVRTQNDVVVSVGFGFRP